MSREYKNGKIYCIRNTVNDDVYVGSSCEPYLSKRMVKHWSSAKNERDRNMLLYQKMNEIGIENFYIELIENYPCESKDQLRAREGHYIREMATLNKRIETRTDKEWREGNKEYIYKNGRNNIMKIIKKKSTKSPNNTEQRTKTSSDNAVKITMSRTKKKSKRRLMNIELKMQML